MLQNPLLCLRCVCSMQAHDLHDARDAHDAHDAHAPFALEEVEIALEPRKARLRSRRLKHPKSI